MTQREALAHDTIRIALKIAGVKNVDTMTQFERASALLNMAEEINFLRGSNMLLDCRKRNLMRKVGIWKRLAIRSWEITLGE